MSESKSAGASPKKPRRRRLLWYVLGGLVVVMLVAALALPALLDVERYRGHIESALSSATGWQAELGAIEFSPWRGMVLTVKPASLRAPGDSSRFDADGLRRCRAGEKPGHGFRHCVSRFPSFPRRRKPVVYT